jgi:hypothetical protein
MRGDVEHRRFGSPAAFTLGGSRVVGPWLCAPIFRRVCPYRCLVFGCEALHATGSPSDRGHIAGHQRHQRHGLSAVTTRSWLVVRRPRRPADYPLRPWPRHVPPSNCAQSAPIASSWQRQGSYLPIRDTKERRSKISLTPRDAAKGRTTSTSLPRRRPWWLLWTPGSLNDRYDCSRLLVPRPTPSCQGLGKRSPGRTLAGRPSYWSSSGRRGGATPG